ncbi:pyrroline-5-carboxylate reductase [Thioclava sp. BHET1]|nr:pyrroline-5-carboxylate reductase [Thioclava sp. BHET1]
MNILLIGCGKMGGAMLRQWIANDANRFTVATPTRRALPEGVAHVSGADELPDAEFDLILIAVKPQMIADVLPAYVGKLKPEGCFVSIAAGTSLASLGAITGDVAVLRVMPNMAAMVGKGVSGLVANDRASTAQIGAVTAFIAETGSCLALGSEDEIDRLTAISGSGPGYVFEILRSYVAAAMELGFSPETARQLVLDTVAGTVETAQRAPESLTDLRLSVTSKNGTTEAGLKQLMRDGTLDTLLRDTVTAAYHRAGELK